MMIGLLVGAFGYAFQSTAFFYAFKGRSERFYKDSNEVAMEKALSGP